MVKKQTGCFTTRTGCMIIGCLELAAVNFCILGSLGVLLCEYLGLYNETRDNLECYFAVNDDTCPDTVTKSPEGIHSGALATFIISIAYLVIPCFLIYGTRKEKKRFLMPYIVCSIKKIILLLGAIKYVLCASPVVHEHVILAVVLTGLEINICAIVAYHYFYLKKIEKESKQNSCEPYLPSVPAMDNVYVNVDPPPYTEMPQANSFALGQR